MAHAPARVLHADAFPRHPKLVANLHPEDGQPMNCLVRTAGAERAARDGLHLLPPRHRARRLTLKTHLLVVRLEHAEIAVPLVSGHRGVIGERQVERLARPEVEHFRHVHAGIRKRHFVLPSFGGLDTHPAYTLRLVGSDTNNVRPVLVTQRPHELPHDSRFQLGRAETRGRVGDPAHGDEVRKWMLGGHWVCRTCRRFVGNLNEARLFYAGRQCREVKAEGSADPCRRLGNVRALVSRQVPASIFEPADRHAPRLRTRVHKVERSVVLLARITEEDVNIRLKPSVEDATEHVAARASAREGNEGWTLDEKGIVHASKRNASAVMCNRISMDRPFGLRPTGRCGVTGRVND